MDYLSMVQKRGLLLEQVPLEEITEQICQAAVQNHCGALRYVPDERKTSELCFLAVRNNGTSLRFVPEPLKTEELCRLAIETFPWGLKFVPDELKTEELCDFAFRSCIKNSKPSDLFTDGNLNEQGKKLFDLLAKSTPENLVSKLMEKYSQIETRVETY